MYYDQYTFNNRYEQWKDISNAVAVGIGEEIKGSTQVDILKYKVDITNDGALVVDFEPSALGQALKINVFNSAEDKWIVSSPKENGLGVFVQNVKKGETYYLVIDQAELTNEQKNLYKINH
ncbi:hypothetical protein M4D58_26640 [Brevibacillus borstelensis]|uniref:hypothetical protein n=1 Tax=Brevibacillus borstelensis TaxID=45462 RepID=UPI00203A45FF|nr:hypothetical protein [Brevibacillus borstelensis]MCM3594125.1 hypothetical protein [Brevibacillus borstelensis]